MTICLDKRKIKMCNKKWVCRQAHPECIGKTAFERVLCKKKFHHVSSVFSEYAGNVTVAEFRQIRFG